MRKNTKNPNSLLVPSVKSSYNLHTFHQYLEKRENDSLCKNLLDFSFRLYIRYKVPVSRSTIRKYIKEYSEIYKISQGNTYFQIDPSIPEHLSYTSGTTFTKAKNIYTIFFADVIEIRKIERKESSIILLQIITRESLVYYLNKMTPRLSCIPANRHSIQGNHLTGLNWYFLHHYRKLLKSITK